MNAAISEFDWQIESLRDCDREQRGLIEAAPPHPAMMQRYRNHHIAVVSRVGEVVAKKFRKRAAQRLIESVFVASNERGQRTSIAFRRWTVARDGPSAGEVWTLLETERAKRITRHA